MLQFSVRFIKDTATVAANVNATATVVTWFHDAKDNRARVQARGTPFVLPVSTTRLKVPQVGPQKSN